MRATSVCLIKSEITKLLLVSFLIWLLGVKIRCRPIPNSGKSKRLKSDIWGRNLEQPVMKLTFSEYNLLKYCLNYFDYLHLYTSSMLLSFNAFSY